MPASGEIMVAWPFPSNTTGLKRDSLLAMGFQKEHGIDCEEAFATIVRSCSCRILLAWLGSHRWGQWFFMGVWILVYTRDHLESLDWAEEGGR
jgi:hypothetical protein